MKKALLKFLDTINKRPLNTGVLAGLLVTLALGLLFITTMALQPNKALAHGGISHCVGMSCPSGYCTGNIRFNQIVQFLTEDHENGETPILAFIREEFHIHREWIVNTYLIRLFIPALLNMSTQMVNVAMFQMEVVGEFFDAKLHLETQRLFNELQNEAAKDYYPSETFCWFGTNARSLSHSELLAQSNQAAMSKQAMTRQLAGINQASAYQSTSEEMRSRWGQFITDYCDPHDNNWRTAGPASYGLQGACGAGSNGLRTNIDIDYQRLIDGERTLDADFRAAGLTDDEEDVIALGRNLYGHRPLKSNISSMNKEDSQPLFMELRALASRRAVAENTYNTIVGMKTSGSAGGASPTYLKAILRDLGMPPAEIDDIVGANPSFYAQMEVLSKKMFQNTNFFTDLYDKPANVKRKMAALNAIELMLDRAIYESEMRHELIISVLLSSNLTDLKSTRGNTLSTSQGILSSE